MMAVRFGDWLVESWGYSSTTTPEVRHLFAVFLGFEEAKDKEKKEWAMSFVLALCQGSVSQGQLIRYGFLWWQRGRIFHFFWKDDRPYLILARGRKKIVLEATSEIERAVQMIAKMEEVKAKNIMIQHGL